MSVTWLLVICCCALVVVAVALRDRWCRWWFEVEDPRSIAVFRIAFAFWLFWNVNGLWPWFEFLFTSEGMFTGGEARAAFAHSGRSHDSGLVSLLRDILIGPFSILYLWDDPLAFWIVLGLFECSVLLLMVGLWTRPAGILTLVSADTILSRNFVFWEGTEVVFRVFLVYLVCARSGEVYSIDQWLRGRRAAAKGRAAAVRLIPAWPRRLMMVQVSMLFVTTGLLKHDGAWLDGDAVYYALTYDHFARFRLEPVLARVGEGVFAFLTWGARSVEVFFPLAMIGIVGRWCAARFEPLHGIRRTVVSVSSTVGIAASALIVYTTGAPRLIPVASRELAVASWLAVVGGTCWWWRLAGCSGSFAEGRYVDAAWLGSRIYGRRVWVAGAALVLLGMLVFMNIGLFHPLTMATLVVFFRGEEVAAVLRRLGRWKHTAEPIPSKRSSELAYSRWTRRMGGILLGWHILALGVAALPPSEVTTPLRDRVGVVAGPWMSMTRTRQSWGMWAKVPTENVFLKAVVVDGDGNERDLRTDLYVPELRPPRPFGYERWWKIAERIIKSDDTAPYRSAYARWLCRHHAGADTPAVVELRSVTYPIPSPSENRRDGGVDLDSRLRESALERMVLTMDCS